MAASLPWLDEWGEAAQWREWISGGGREVRTLSIRELEVLAFI